MKKEIGITFITPCFCRGADCSEKGRPEIRAASIRGQLHWWFRALGGKWEDERAIFGSVGKQAVASKIVIRTLWGTPAASKFPTLPHKRDWDSSKEALPPGTEFRLLISDRLGGLTPEQSRLFEQALSAWLHLGALGLRATRGGGNFRWEGQPTTPEAYKTALRQFPGIKAALLDSESFPDAETARRIITDTLKDDAFQGRATLGTLKPRRKTSPLRFRVVELENRFYIAAAWDTRTEVTGNTPADLAQAVRTLADSRKKIGSLLAAAGWGA